MSIWGEQHGLLSILDRFLDVARHLCTLKPTPEGIPKVGEYHWFVRMSIWGEQHGLLQIFDRLVEVARSFPEVAEIPPFTGMSIWAE